MRVPFIDLSRTLGKIKKDVLKDWEHCFDQCEFVGGPGVKILEDRLQERMGVSNFVTCANGTDALIVGLLAMGVKPGMRVAVPNMTFWAPYEAIIQVGAVPVLVDVSDDDLQMDLDEFKSAHEKFRFDAAILVHLFGWVSSRLREYRHWCRENNILLIEDGAQAFDVVSEGESVYRDAMLGTVSFYPAKVFGGASDGGGISSNNGKIAEVVRALCNHGRAGHYTYDYVGFNSRMGGLNARFLGRVLDHMDDFLESRRAAEAFYQEYFAAHTDLVKVHKAPEGVESNGYLSVITCLKKSADEMVAKMRDAGVGCARTYPQTIAYQPPVKNCMRSSDLVRSEAFSKSVINLPLFAGITLVECEYAADQLLKALRS